MAHPVITLKLDYRRPSSIRSLRDDWVRELRSVPDPHILQGRAGDRVLVLLSGMKIISWSQYVRHQPYPMFRIGYVCNPLLSLVQQYDSVFCLMSYHLTHILQLTESAKCRNTDTNHRLQILLGHPHCSSSRTSALPSHPVVDECLQRRQSRYGFSLRVRPRRETDPEQSTK